MYSFLSVCLLAALYDGIKW